MRPVVRSLFPSPHRFRLFCGIAITSEQKYVEKEEPKFEKIAKKERTFGDPNVLLLLCVVAAASTLPHPSRSQPQADRNHVGKYEHGGSPWSDGCSCGDHGTCR